MDAQTKKPEQPQSPLEILPDNEGADVYWQGPFYAPGLEEFVAQKDASEAPAILGSVSPRARLRYADEAMYEKDHIAAALLAIFLGVFGIHKFYLGCNKAGFSMLAFSILGSMVTLGLAAMVVEVIAIIEAIIYLSRTQTQFQSIYVMNHRDWF